MRTRIKYLHIYNLTTTKSMAQEPRNTFSAKLVPILETMIDVRGMYRHTIPKFSR